MKKNKSQAELLDEAIRRLEKSRLEQKRGFQLQWKDTVDSVRPGNLLNQVVSDISKTPETKTNLVTFVTSVLGGYATKRLFIGKSNSAVKKILGYLFQHQITRFIANRVN